jgi:hypothetical protein
MTSRPSSKDLISIGTTDVGPLIDAFDALPKNLHNRHLGAAMKKALRKAKAIQTLRRVTEESVPGLNPRLVARKQAAPRRNKDGSFRKGARSRLKVERSKSEFLNKIKLFVSKRRWPGHSKGARPLIARVGWVYPTESIKAIWLEEGTVVARAFRFVQKAMVLIRPKFNEHIREELLNGIEAAAKVMRANVIKKGGRVFDYSTYRRKRKPRK